MAQRRMFSPKIVNSDAFLDMPVSTQALYFHLGMHADDDGFVNPRFVMRMAGASEDDLKVLLTKRFLLPFENGVIVIKHWRINNQIKPDRYHPTIYQDQYKQLAIKENGSYTEKVMEISQRFQIGTQMEPEVRLGKVRLVPIAANAAEWVLEEKFNEMKESSRRELQILALYYAHKEFKPENSSQLSSAIKRDIRAAKEIIGYANERIVEIMEWLGDNADFKWTLETVHKYIDENLGKKKFNARIHA